MRARQVLAILIMSLIACPARNDVESPSPLSSVGCGTEETELGDLVADAVRAAARTRLAVMPAGGLREVTIQKGEVETDRIIECLQYPNDHIAILELTGDELTQALERSVVVYPQKNLGFLQVSGISLTFDPEAARAARISSIKAGGEPVEPSGKYRVATTEPLAKGGYGYFTVWTKEHVKELSKSTVRDAVRQFLADRKSVDYRHEKRITVKKN